MTPAERMVRAKGWRWLPGMLATGEGWIGEARVVEATDGVPDLWMYRGHSRGPCTSHVPGDEAPWEESHTDPVPDLTDPATLGAIEHGLLGPAGWWVFFMGPARAWCVHREGVGLPWRLTLAEALADAVEALG